MIPTWVGEYIGLPWRADGGARDGVNCWGLLALVYRERFGLELGHVGTLAGSEAADVVAVLERSAAHWAEVVDRRRVVLGDAVLLRVMGRWHVGMVVEPWRMLHVDGRTSGLERFDGIAWGSRVVSIHRHAGVLDGAPAAMCCQSTDLCGHSTRTT